MISSKFIQKELQAFVEDVEETVLRLHVNARNWEEKYDQFKKSNGLILKGKINIRHIDDAMREELKFKGEYTYYQGKLMAYIYVLENLGSEVPCLIERLRGIKQVAGNQMIETKAHYSEVKGHFDTEQWKEWKKRHGKS